MTPPPHTHPPGGLAGAFLPANPRQPRPPLLFLSGCPASARLAPCLNLPAAPQPPCPAAEGSADAFIEKEVRALGSLKNPPRIVVVSNDNDLRTTASVSEFRPLLCSVSAFLDHMRKADENMREEIRKTGDGTLTVTAKKVRKGEGRLAAASRLPPVTTTKSLCGGALTGARRPACLRSNTTGSRTSQGGQTASPRSGLSSWRRRRPPAPRSSGSHHGGRKAPAAAVFPPAPAAPQQQQQRTRRRRGLDDDGGREQSSFIFFLKAKNTVVDDR